MARFTRGEEWAVAQEGKRGRVGGVGRPAGLGRRAGAGRATQRREGECAGGDGWPAEKGPSSVREGCFDLFQVNSVRYCNSNIFEANKLSKLFQSLFFKILKIDKSLFVA